MSDLTSDLTPRQLADLLGMAREAAAPDSPADALEALLGAPISADPASPAAPPAVLGRACDELRPHAGRRIGDVLTGGDADLAALTTLKDYGKALVGLAELEAHRAAATALYYAAIAAALVLHGERISRYDLGELCEGFAALEAKPWLPPELADLLAAARAEAG
ncbi:MAG: hypothetical protein R6V58_06670 [Planctomycetota bacterium]